MEIKKTVMKLALGVTLLSSGAVAYAQATPAKKDSTVVESGSVQTNPTIEALKKQVEANPKDADALGKLAVAYQDIKNWDGALDSWMKLSALVPDWAPSYYSQGYVYQSMKKNEEAKNAYEKYISAVKPEELEANKKNLAYAHLFVAYSLFETDKNLAKQHIAKSLQYDPTNPDAQNLNKSLNE